MMPDCVSVDIVAQVAAIAAREAEELVAVHAALKIVCDLQRVYDPTYPIDFPLSRTSMTDEVKGNRDSLRKERRALEERREQLVERLRTRVADGRA